MSLLLFLENETCGETFPYEPLNFTQDIRLSYYFDSLSAMFEQDVQTRRHAPRTAHWSRLRSFYLNILEVIRKTYIRSTRKGSYGKVSPHYSHKTKEETNVPPYTWRYPLACTRSFAPAPPRDIVARSWARSHDCATAWEQVPAVCSHAHFACTHKGLPKQPSKIPSKPCLQNRTVPSFP